MFQDSNFISFLQASFDKKAAKGESFTLQEKATDWKLAHVSGNTKSVRYWSTRWSCSTSTAHAALKTFKPFATPPAKCSDSTPEPNTPPNTPPNTLPNAPESKKAANTHPKTRVFKAKADHEPNALPNTLPNVQPNTTEGGYNNAHARTHAHTQGINTHILNNITPVGRNEATGAGNVFDESEILVGEGKDAFALKDVTGFLWAHSKNNSDFREAFRASGANMQDFARAIFNHYGARLAQSKSGINVTKKNLYFIIGSAWITPRINDIRAGKAPADVFRFSFNRSTDFTNYGDSAQADFLRNF